MCPIVLEGRPRWKKEKKLPFLSLGDRARVKELISMKVQFSKARFLGITPSNQSTITLDDNSSSFNSVIIQGGNLNARARAEASLKRTTHARAQFTLTVMFLGRVVGRATVTFSTVVSITKQLGHVGQGKKYMIKHVLL